MIWGKILATALFLMVASMVTYVASKRYLGVQKVCAVIYSAAFLVVPVAVIGVIWSL